MPLVVLVAVLASGCASLNERKSLVPSAVPQAARAYLYGRFTLHPKSHGQPRLLLRLFDVTREASMSIPLRRTRQEIYVTDVAPGRYQFTQLMVVHTGEMDADTVRRDNLQFPAQMNFMGRPFDVEPGKAYYVPAIGQLETLPAWRN